MQNTHSVIIIDDEAIIREGLTDMVDWAKLGYEVAACFSDGRDAIEYLAGHDVDVILTDIKMDDVGGMELARYTHENKPETRIVIISGYRDFSFAREAIQYRASSYLLKPIDFDELQSVFEELKRTLVASNTSTDDAPPSAQQFASDLVAGKISARVDLVRRTDALDIGLDVDTSPAALLLIDFETRRARSQQPAVRDGILGSLQKQCAVSLFEPALTLNDKIVVLAADSDSQGADSLTAVLRERLSEAVESIRSAFQVPIVAEILACENGLGEIMASNAALVAQQALSARRHLEHPARSAEEVPFLKRVIAYLEENYATDVSLADAAALAFLSPVYFSRVFHERVGVTFTEYLASIRINKAIELLREQRYKVYEVAEMVGYASPRYFARVFKKTTGFSPREYCTEILARELTG